MSSLERYLLDNTTREVPYGHAKVARYAGGGLWEIYFASRGQASRREGSASTDDVRRKQRAGSYELERLERIVTALG